MTNVGYHLPPDDYEAPTAACCERVVIFVPVIGGHKWVHLNFGDDHPVMLAARWFDTATGDWHEPGDVFVQRPSPGDVEHGGHE